MKTDFSEIVFDQQNHRYHVKGRELTSVTRFLKQFQIPFDRKGASQRVAKKENRPADEILAEWDAKGQAAIELGPRVHAHIENTLKGKSAPSDPFLNLNEPCPEIKAFNSLWRHLKHTVRVDQVEWVIGDACLGLAGIVDALLFNQETGQYHLWDWKTGKFDLENKWQDLLPPFNHASDSKFNVYSIQLSLYQLIVELNTDLPIGHSYLVHLAADGSYHIYRAIDFRPTLARYFENSQ